MSLHDSGTNILGNQGGGERRVVQKGVMQGCLTVLTVWAQWEDKFQHRRPGKGNSIGIPKSIKSSCNELPPTDFVTAVCQ